MSFRVVSTKLTVGCLALGLTVLAGCSKSKSDSNTAVAGGTATENGGGTAAENGGGTTAENGGGAADEPGTSEGGSTSPGSAGTSPGSAGTSSLPTGSCPAGTLLKALGKTKLLIGGAMTDATAKLAPFDTRYLYLSGAFPDGDKPCTSCASGCTTGGTTCANTGPGCQWWGCWQFDKDPPGAYLRTFIATAKADGQIPMVSLYMILQASKVVEGPAEVTAANDPSVMTRYFDEFRFLLKQVGSDVALLHMEPDFWGYAEQLNPDPTKIPAAVASANPTDCKNLPNTIAGMGNCLVAMSHAYAPKAKIGLHASGWATKVDALLNSDPKVDISAIGTKTGAFVGAAAADADFVVIDAADRDAAWYKTQGKQTAWDDTNKTLPNFTQAFAWAKAVSIAAAKPVFWWQTPIGNQSLPNTDGKWKDNRLDYFMTHLDEVAAAQGFGVAFGAGLGGQTTFETDGGNGIAKVKAAAAAGGQNPCP